MLNLEDVVIQVMMQLWSELDFYLDTLYIDMIISL